MLKSVKTKTVVPAVIKWCKNGQNIIVGASPVISMQVSDIKEKRVETPPELENQGKSTLAWVVFALFVALAPFIVILIPKIAGPMVLFGALIFCGFFLIKDQRSNLHKNALKLWQAREKAVPIKVDLMAQAGENKRFYFGLDKSSTTLDTENFIISQTSEGGREKLASLLAGKERIELPKASLVSVKESEDLILILLGSHRYWCRPWNFQLNFNDQIKFFEEKSQ